MNSLQHIWVTSINMQEKLAKENKKFIPSKVISGGRFSRLCSAVGWFTGAGLINFYLAKQSFCFVQDSDKIVVCTYRSDLL
ncbi:MAG: hypothetical protein OCD02_00585 [Spirochaetaceae bacterium]